MGTQHWEHLDLGENTNFGVPRVVEHLDFGGIPGFGGGTPGFGGIWGGWRGDNSRTRVTKWEGGVTKWGRGGFSCVTSASQQRDGCDVIWKGQRVMSSAGRVTSWKGWCDVIVIGRG